MGMDYYVACPKCNLCVWAWWRNAGRACGTPLAEPDKASRFQAFVDEHIGHGLTFVNEHDAARMDTPEERAELTADPAP